MTARVLFVGLDAADPVLLQRWSEEGRLPNFAAFADGAASFRLVNSLGTIGAGVWNELNNGQWCGRTGVFLPARQLHTGEAAPRTVEASELDPRAYWTAASDAGKRVAVVDIPQSVTPENLNGVLLTGWGAHDRFHGPASIPPDLVDDLQGRHGDYPLWSRPWPKPTTAACDGHDGTTEQYAQLLDDLLLGIERKRGLVLDVLGRDDWDLFACAFSEGQCSGHQLWHLFDDSMPDGGDDRLAGGILEIYERLDSAFGALLAAAGSDATVFVVASHGFAPPTGGRQLLPEVLQRLGYGSGSGASARMRSRVPPGMRRLARKVLPRRATQSLQTRAGTLDHPLDSPLTKAAALEGDRCGWIRLNVKGREPNGAVEPGSEAEQIMADIRAELLLLEQPETGERIVSRVYSAEEAFGKDHHPDVPDLMVDFRIDLGVLDACRSSRVGLVHAPLQGVARRSGAHPAVPSCLWMAGPGVTATGRWGDGNAVDLAPTILSRLAVPQPDWIEGKPLI